jgi:gluconate 2-dehydrogenase
MRQKVLITRKIFNEVITFVKGHFEVEDDQNDAPFSPDELIKRLQGKSGAIILLTDGIDEALFAVPQPQNRIERRGRL